jgi:hypothetical protein
VAREIGGYNENPDWPKPGPSLLIASAFILAIRTAKWPASHDSKLSNVDLQIEIDYSIHLADSVLSHLLADKSLLFPHTRKPWYQPDNDDIPK